MQVPEVTSVVTPYRIDIRQGNYISQEMVAQLKPGMSRDQVRFLLGTPLVTDIFHADRWDYIYRFKPGRGELQQRRLAVFFEDNKLVRVAGDVTGAEAAGAARSRIIEIEPDPALKKAADDKQAEEAKKAEAASPAADTK